MRPTVSGLSSVSLRCHEVRSLSYPSVSQFALAWPCAPTVAVDAAATITVATIPPPLQYDIGFTRRVPQDDGARRETTTADRAYRAVWAGGLRR